jgi:flagellar hook assembly protein FlgD
LSESAAAKVTIYTKKGTVIRTMTANKPAGATYIKWNGKNDGGVLAAAGIYYYRITATDAAGNAKSSAKYATRLAYHQFVRTSRGIRVIDR